jgi:hypothetical protein
MKRVLSFLFTVACYGQLTVTVPHATSTQAALVYTAPSTDPCTIEVSESNIYSPLVHDIDGSLFSGANLDSRAGTLISGTSRIFLVGTRQIQTGLDSNNYSRALQQGTTHYYRVTCDAQVATGTFTTQTLPMGVTQEDLFPLTAAGTYNWPTASATNRNETLVDPSTGVLLRHVSLPGDNAGTSGGDGPAGSAGGFGNFANNVQTANGNWLVAFTDINQGIYPNLYSINATTGVVNYLGWAGFFPASIDPNGASIHGIRQGETVMWDYTNPNVAYTGYQVVATNRRSLAKWTYTGNDVAQTGGTQAPATVVDMLGSTSSTPGSDLNALASAYATAHGKTLDLSIYQCSFAEFIGGHYVTFTCRGGNQNSMGWLGAYDLGNALPLGSGGTGAVIALAFMPSLPGSRWCTQHTDEYMPFAIWSEAVDTAFGSGTMMGPWNAQLNGSMTSGQTLITLTSTLSSPPAGYTVGDPVSAYPQFYLQSWAIGDYLTVDGEVMQLTGGSNPTWTIARAQGGTSAASHSSGANALATCTSQGNALTYSGGYLWWDFLASPDGTNTADWQIQFGSHPVSRGNYRVDSGWPFRTGAPTNHASWGQPYTGTITPLSTFGGQYANCSGNACQKHPSMATGGTLTTFFDQNYWVGTSLWCAASSSCTTPISGSLYLYNYSTSVNAGLVPPVNVARKHLPSVVKTQGRSFQDISGPGSVIDGTSAHAYQYCVTLLSNECVSGSSPGNIYVNDPGLNPAVGCSGGENPTIDQDLCFGNFPPFAIGANQYLIANDSTGGTSYRHLTNLFGGFEGISTNVKLTYDGNWAFYFVPPPAGWSVPSGATAIYAIKVPPIPASDGIDRSTFIPAVVNVTTPGGLGIAKARLKFGYAEQGPVSSLYPTSRRETGVVTALTITPSTPFYFASETYAPPSCVATCSFAIPVYPLHTAYYTVEFLNGSNSVVATTSGIALESTVVPLGPPGPPPPPPSFVNTGPVFVIN